ncbi:MAG: M23 family metallopeptidase [Haliea sp.]|nr:M23 family metallopeptidase [Haliea sp.]
MYNPDGTLEDYAYGSNTVAALDCYSSGSCRLEQTGTYRILIQDDGNGYPGNYEIHFSRMPYANENGPLLNNGVVTDKIALGDIDSFTFKADAGDAAHIRIVETGGDTAFTPDFWLYNPDGTLEDYAYGSNTVAALDCYSSGSCRLEQTGTYRILIQDDGNGYPGNYEIHFSRMPYANENGYPINGGLVEGSITTVDIDSFVFYASAGESAFITVQEPNGDTNFVPDFWLYNPDGTLEDYAYGSNTVAALDCYSSGSCRLEQTGTYRILIQDDGNFYPGAYQMLFNGPTQPSYPITQFRQFNWPLSPFNTVPNITQDYSCGDAACFASPKHHTGLDLTPTTTNYGVYAAAAGTIVAARTRTNCPTTGDKTCNSGFGNTLVIDHGTGIFSLYAHLKPGSFLRTSGFVGKGEKLAWSARPEMLLAPTCTGS